MDDARLTRIEDKVDRLSETLSTLVRVEERVTVIFSRLDSMDAGAIARGNRIAELERTTNQRLVALERFAEGRTRILQFGERFFWIVATASVTLAFAYLRP